MHLFCNMVRIGRSRSSKVVDLGTNRRVVCDFLWVINVNFGRILHRFWDTATYWLKIAHFSYPTPTLTPSLRWTISNFWTNFFYPKNYSPWAIYQWRFRDPSLRSFHSVPACDGQTDGQTSWRSLVQGLHSRLCWQLCWRPVKELLVLKKKI